MTYEEIFLEVSKMRFTWDEVMLILNNVGKSVVLGCSNGGLISRHSQKGNLVCTFESDIFFDFDKYSENILAKYKSYLYRFEGLYSSWNAERFYNYIKENNIR